MTVKEPLPVAYELGCWHFQESGDVRAKEYLYQEISWKVLGALPSCDSMNEIYILYFCKIYIN